MCVGVALTIEYRRRAGEASGTSDNMELVKQTAVHHDMKYVDHRESLERDHVAKSSVHEWGGFTERECWEEAAVLHRYVGDPHMCVRTPTKAGKGPFGRMREHTT